MSQQTTYPLDPPANKVTVTRINSFTVNVTNVVLNTSADLQIAMFNDGNLVDFRIVQISGTAYTDWGSNDQYIVNYTANWIHENYHL